MKKVPQKLRLREKRWNYHFDLPMEMAERFNRWAKEEDRSLASMFRRLIERETEARGE